MRTLTVDVGAEHAIAREPDEEGHRDEAEEQRHGENGQLPPRARQGAVTLAQAREAHQGCHSVDRGRGGHFTSGVAARAGIIAFSCRKSEPPSSGWATWGGFTRRSTRKRRGASSSRSRTPARRRASRSPPSSRSEEHTSELQSRGHLVCRLL